MVIGIAYLQERMCYHGCIFKRKNASYFASVWFEKELVLTKEYRVHESRLNHLMVTKNSQKYMFFFGDIICRMQV